MSIQTVKAIDGIKFCVWSPNEIRKYSVGEITAPETMMKMVWRYRVH